MNRLLASLCLGGLASVCVLAQPKVIRVPQDQPTVQAGINAAVNGDTVLVAEGTYVENIKINKKIVLGSRYVVDLDTMHISRTIIDGSGSTNPDSGSTITLRATTDTTLHIIGFTIRGGKGNKSGDPGVPPGYWLGGGGIESSVGGSARITHNIITRNHLVPRGAVTNMVGGGISLDGNSSVRDPSVIIDSNLISGNTISGSFVEAAGIGLYYMAYARIEGNVIELNTATCTGSGHSLGGGIGCSLGNFVLSRNLIRGNSVTGGSTTPCRGGGVVLANGNNFEVNNNVIVDNVSTGGGGGLQMGGSVVVDLVNNTFAENQAQGISGGSAMYSTGNPIVRAMNNIFSGPSGQTLYYLSGTYTFQNNLFWPASWATGVNAIGADPVFVGTTDMYYIHAYGAAKDAGITSATVGGRLLTAPATDFRGRGREGSPDLGAHEFDPTVGVESKGDRIIPKKFTLEQNYPNPFNPATTIDYELPSQGHVVLKVYDLLGQEVAVLVDEVQPAGYKSVSFDASGLPSGVYYYRLTAGRHTAAKSLVLLK